MMKRWMLAAAVAATMTTGAFAQTDVSATKQPGVGTRSTKVTVSGSGKKMKTATARNPAPDHQRNKGMARKRTAR